MPGMVIIVLCLLMDKLDQGNHIQWWVLIIYLSFYLNANKKIFNKFHIGYKPNVGIVPITSNKMF